LLPLGFAPLDGGFEPPALAPGAAFAAGAFGLATNRPVAVRGLAAAAADRDGAAVRFKATAARFGAVEARVADPAFAAAGFAGAGFADGAFTTVARALTVGARTALGAASSAASLLVALLSWRRRFSTLARALAIALSRSTSASARRNDSVAALPLPVPFFAMDMTLHV
jgi:hypothetical protein